MMENRPFDHYYGFAQAQLPGIDGLTGDEFNRLNASDPSSRVEKVANGKANYVCKTPSVESWGIYVNDFYGPGVWNGSKTPCPPASMDGFLEENKGSAEIMHQFSPQQIPVKIALAQEFALFDRYFTSMPTPSTPNHLFLQTGTAAGCTETDAPYRCAPHTQPYALNGTYPQKTIYESLAENGHTWAYWYNDTAWNAFMRFFHTKEGKAGMRPYSEFYDRAANGTLPSFSFMAPRQGTNATTGQGPNDDHPCHDVALGERLIKDTYEALRAGKGWNKTMLLVVWDDGGGWYDHVPPPCDGVPAPDDEPSCPDKGFDFKRLGARVPLLLASPWVPKGTVVHAPTAKVGSAARPFASSQYEHTSILATLKHLYDLPAFLTRRDAWAAPFHHLLSLKEPRDDCPMHLPEAPPPATGAEAACATHGGVQRPELTRRQRRRMERFAAIHGLEIPAVARATQEAAEAWLAKAWRESLRDEL